jgi:trk system potassium uptake protein TrkA
MRILVIGCGRVGSGLARSLSLQGHAVVAVDKDVAAFERLGPAFKGKTVAGVGFDRDVLVQAGIERADGLAAVTASDEANIIIGRLATQVFRVPRVVARLYDPLKAEIYRRLGLQTITPITWGINRIAEMLSYSPLSTVATLGAGDVDIIEAEVPPALVGRTVRDLTVPAEANVISVTRNGSSFLPTSGAVLQDGDIIHLVVLGASADRIRSMLSLG